MAVRKGGGHIRDRSSMAQRARNRSFRGRTEMEKWGPFGACAEHRAQRNLKAGFLHIAITLHYSVHDYRPWRIATNGAFDALSGCRLHAPGLQASGLDSGKYRCSRLSEGASAESVGTNGSGEDSFRASPQHAANLAACSAKHRDPNTPYCPHSSYRARGTHGTAI